MKRVLGINTGSKRFGDQFTAACEAAGIAFVKLRARNTVLSIGAHGVLVFHEGEPVELGSFEYAFIRTAGKYHTMIGLLATMLHAHGVPFNDPHNRTYARSEDKITQMLLLKLAGLPIPDSVLFTLRGYPKNKAAILNTMTYPCVLKTNGEKGTSVWKIESETELDERIEAIDESKEVAMLQEFVPNEYDIRALFFYGTYLGAMKRMSANGFHNNVSMGGRVEKTDLSDEERTLALRACALLERDLAGVDIVRTEKGPLFFEVNARPSIYGFEEATGIDVPRELVHTIDKKFLS